MGAALAFLSCLVGDLPLACVIIAKGNGLTVLGVLSRLRFEGVIGFAKGMANSGDAIFCAIAVYEGYRFSARKLTQVDYL
jgi:hypothetical protein